MQKTGGEYRLSFFASRLTPFTEGQSSSIYLSLAPPSSPQSTSNFVPIQPTRVTIGDAEAHRVDYFISSDTLAPYFADGKMRNHMAIVRGQFTVNIRFPRNVDKLYTVPITLALLPLYAGEVSVSGTFDNYDWSDIPPPQGKDQDGLDMDCHHRDHDDCNHPDSQAYSWALPRLPFTRDDSEIHPGSRRYDPSRVSLTCEPHGPVTVNQSVPGFGITIPVLVHKACEWTNSRWEGEAPDYAVVTATTSNWSGPVKWTLSAIIQEWKLKNSTPLERASQAMTYGKTLDVEVPDKASNVKLHVTTMDHRSFEVPIGTDDPSSLQIRGVEKTQHNTRIFHYLPIAPDLN